MEKLSETFSKKEIWMLILQDLEGVPSFSKNTLKD